MLNNVFKLCIIFMFEDPIWRIVKWIVYESF